MNEEQPLNGPEDIAGPATAKIGTFIVLVLVVGASFLAGAKYGKPVLDLLQKAKA